MDNPTQHPNLFDAVPLIGLCGQPVVHLAETDSTNRVARERARRGEGGVVVADHQTAGRGRLGRIWTSAPGENLLFSAILPLTVPLARAPRAVLVWAAHLAEVLDCRVKWPNDLVDGSARKLGGILAELESDPDGHPVVVLGVGLNVNQVEFPDLPYATSVRLLRGQPVDRADLFVALVRALYAADIGLPDGLDRWRARSDTLGRRVRVGDVEGLATGLRDDGALLIDGQPILAGDVHLL